MKRIVCLGAVLALAVVASAADIVIYDGSFHSPYVSGPQPPQDMSGVRWWEWFFEHTHPVDGLPSARAQGSGINNVRTDGATWNPDYNPPTTLSLAGNRYIEFDAYFYHGNSRIPETGTTPVYRPGVKFDTMYLQVNSDDGLTYKWDTGVDMWVDDVYYSDMGVWAADPNTWVHIKIDLLSNSAPAAQIDVGSDTVGLIRFNMPVTVDFHVRNAKFTGAGTVNIAPSVNAGQDRTITSPVCEIVLNGSVTDDGLPDPPGQVTSAWDIVSGPATVAFGDVSSPTTTATFSAVGIYELRLTASDGELTRSDTLAVTVEDFSPDLNDDGAVDAWDLAYVAEQWLGGGGSPSADIRPAPVTDGIVNHRDYAKVASHWRGSEDDAAYLDGWRMAGANPARTSWVPEEVGGMKYLEWYKPFEPMIAHKVQIVAADGLLYISTSRGLYAVDADSGDVVWVYPTELPLGHSPTVVGGVAYVGCFDRRIHAINAATGAGIWTSEIAGAGFDVNPLVVEGKVIAGNRDGMLYCFDASTGSTLWTHATDLKQPICFSCAYKDGVVYFAANDLHAYAVDVHGNRVWKSAKLPGAGFWSWWPVVHGNYVVFTGSPNFREGGTPTTPGGFLQAEDKDIFGSDLSEESGYGGAVVSSSPLILDLSQASAPPEENGPVTEYLRGKPSRRTYFLLKRNDGSEKMYDFNGDGQMEYAPLVFMGTHSGSRSAPVVGSDGYQYVLTGAVEGSPFISRGGICKWELDSPQIRSYMKIAHDEPTILAAGGNYVHYYRGAAIVSYQGSVNTATGGYSQYYWRIDNVEPTIYDYLRLRPNDMYGRHGDQNPGIPYNGKVYNQVWGYLMCWSGMESKTELSEAQTVTGGPAAPLPTVTKLKTRLAEEVQKMIDAGHLRSGWLNRGLAANSLAAHTSDDFDDYFSLPGETIIVLCRALDHLPTEMRQAARDYITSEFTSYPPDVYAHIGWRGAGREAEDIPPEYNLNDYGPRTSSSHRNTSLYTFPPQANYALYQYARVFGNAGDLVGRLRSLSSPSDETLIEYPWAQNAYIAGYAGIVNLKALAGQSDPAAEAELNRLLQLRASTFTVDRPADPDCPNYRLERNAQETIMRNFLYMTPELAGHLRNNILSTVEAAWREYNTVHPWWLISRACEGTSENAICPLWDYHCLFQAKAQILQESYEELVKYLDVPAYWRGDLYYIDNLCAAIEAGGE